MAAVIKVMVEGTRKYVINITGVFDSSDETDTVVIDRSTLTGPGGVLPNKIRIDEATWAVGLGFSFVKLEFDDATDEVIEYFQGQGYMDYRPYSGKSMTGEPTTADEGDVILTTLGGAAEDTYSILLNCTLKQ